MRTLITGLMVLFIGIGQAQAQTTLFSDNFTGPLTWTTSDPSVSIQNGNLVIGSDGIVNDWANYGFSTPLSLSSNNYIVIEQRTKVVAGGLGYALPWQGVTFEDSSRLWTANLPGLNLDGSSIDPRHLYGWGFGVWQSTGQQGSGHGGDWVAEGDPWSHNDNHDVPTSGYWTTSTANVWAVTRMILTPTGGELFVKPDDAANGWFDDQFYPVASAYWSHSQIDAIGFSQPWDAECDINYINVTSVPGSYTIPDPASFSQISTQEPPPANSPEPSTLVLLGIGAVSLLAYVWRRRRQTA